MAGKAGDNVGAGARLANRRLLCGLRSRHPPGYDEDTFGGASGLVPLLVAQLEENTLLPGIIGERLDAWIRGAGSPTVFTPGRDSEGL